MRCLFVLTGLLALLFLSGCSWSEQLLQEEGGNMFRQEPDTFTENPEHTEESISMEKTEAEEPEPGSATLLYQGQASIRIITDEGKVIYIDPYAGDSYELPTDLILVTHSHFDHSQTDKVENRNEGCQIITYKEAVQDGVHQTFELGFVTVEAVEAGYNSLHDVNDCVGYVLTFSNGKSVYVTGDTSKTEQMSLMDEMEIDYAFPLDSVLALMQDRITFCTIIRFTCEAPHVSLNGYIYFLPQRLYQNQFSRVKKVNLKKFHKKSEERHYISCCFSAFHKSLFGADKPQTVFSLMIICTYAIIM